MNWRSVLLSNVRSGNRVITVAAIVAVLTPTPVPAADWTSALNAYRIADDANRRDGKDEEFIKRLMRKIDFDGRFMPFVTAREEKQLTLEQLRAAVPECSADHKERCASQPVVRRLAGRDREVIELWTLTNYTTKDGQEQSTGERLFVSCGEGMLVHASRAHFDAPYGQGEPGTVYYGILSVRRGGTVNNHKAFLLACSTPPSATDDGNERAEGDMSGPPTSTPEAASN